MGDFEPKYFCTESLTTEFWHLSSRILTMKTQKSCSLKQASA